MSHGQAQRSAAGQDQLAFFLVIRVNAPSLPILAAMTSADVIPLASSADLTSGVASIEPRSFCRSASLRLATTALTCAFVVSGSVSMSTILMLWNAGADWAPGAAGVEGAVGDG